MLLFQFLFALRFLANFHFSRQHHFFFLLIYFSPHKKLESIIFYIYIFYNIFCLPSLDCGSTPILSYAAELYRRPFAAVAVTPLNIWQRTVVTSFPSRHWQRSAESNRRTNDECTSRILLYELLSR